MKEPTQLADSLSRDFINIARMQAKSYRLYEVAEELDLLESDSRDLHYPIWEGLTHMWADTYNSKIDLVFSSSFTPATEFAKRAAIELQRRGVEFEAEEFNATTGEFQQVGEFKGVEIVLRFGAKNCQMEQVTEEVTIPATAERVEKKSFYRLVGECGGEGTEDTKVLNPPESMENLNGI